MHLQGRPGVPGIDGVPGYDGPPGRMGNKVSVPLSLLTTGSFTCCFEPEIVLLTSYIFVRRVLDAPFLAPTSNSLLHNNLCRVLMGCLEVQAQMEALAPSEFKGQRLAVVYITSHLFYPDVLCRVNQVVLEQKETVVL